MIVLKLDVALASRLEGIVQLNCGCHFDQGRLGVRSLK